MGGRSGNCRLLSRGPLEASGDVAEALRERFYAIVDTAGLDERRTRDWIVTRCMINLGWQAEEGAPPGAGLTDAQEWITRNIMIATAMQVPTSAVRLATRTPPKEKWS